MLQHSHHPPKSRKIRNQGKCKLGFSLLPSLTQLLLRQVQRENCVRFQSNWAHTKGSSLDVNGRGELEVQPVGKQCLQPSWPTASTLPLENSWSYNGMKKTCEFESFYILKSKSVTFGFKRCSWEFLPKTNAIQGEKVLWFLTFSLF